MSAWSAPLLTYFLPGFLAGGLVGHVLTRLTKRQVVEEVTHMQDDEATEPVPRQHPSRIPHWLRSRWVLSALIAFVVIVTLGSTFLVFQRQDEQAACLRAVYDTTSKRLNDATRIAAEDRHAVDDMVKGVIDPHKTPKERGQVLVDYLAGRKARDAARAKLPPYPLTAGCPN